MTETYYMHLVGGPEPDRVAECQNGHIMHAMINFQTQKPNCVSS